MRALELKIPPLAVFLVCMAAMWVSARCLPLYPYTMPGAVVVAWLAVIAGLGFGLAGILAFRKHSTTVNPMAPEEASSMVTNGVYRITRNPMYLGLAACLTGWAVYLSDAAVYLGILAFILYMTRFQIRPEERALSNQFGAAYTDYLSVVRRWL